MKTFKSGKIVIIFDIHQNIEYAEKCLEEEADHYVFIGDYFDTHKDPDNKKIFGTEGTCEWLNRKHYELGKKATWLLGNHDLSYVASYNKNFKKAKVNPYYCCTGVTNNKVKNFSKYINPNWFHQLKLCCKVGGFYCSHAGFQDAHMKPFSPLKNNIDYLYESWEKDKHNFHVRPFHWIWDIAENRGGDSKVGSPIWVDFHYEFEPIEFCQQIVGHSASPVWNVQLIKSQKGYPNICGDCSQKMYLIWDDGEIIFVDAINDRRYSFFSTNKEEDGYKLNRIYH